MQEAMHAAVQRGLALQHQSNSGRNNKKGGLFGSWGSAKGRKGRKGGKDGGAGGRPAPPAEPVMPEAGRAPWIYPLGATMAADMDQLLNNNTDDDVDDVDDSGAGAGGGGGGGGGGGDMVVLDLGDGSIVRTRRTVLAAALPMIEVAVLCPDQAMPAPVAGLFERRDPRRFRYVDSTTKADATKDANMPVAARAARAARAGTRRRMARL